MTNFYPISVGSTQNTPRLGIGVMDYEENTLELDDVASHFLGLPNGVPITRCKLRDVLHPDDAKKLTEWSAATSSAGQPQTIATNLRVQQRHGGYRLIHLREATDLPIYPYMAERQLGIFAITDLAENAEDHQTLQLILNEQNHRISNFLTVIGVIAKRLCQTRQDQEFCARFLEKIKSLSLSAERLSQRHTSMMSLRDLIDAQLTAFKCNDRYDIAISGPAIFVRDGAIRPLSMAFYELASNAAKYGGLSNSSGSIEVSWEWIGCSADQLAICWHETSGAPIPAPKKEGFGFHILKKSLPLSLGGEVDISFQEEALTFQFYCPSHHMGLDDPQPVNRG
ncbi:HWE histidine kinase domain-containing protein [Yoonia sp. SDW83-1]|uniref:HWE histidine kinase domain-containing protein n=1 Tax=Yoonia sp. SDW83-1 TaxID=3366945 RepID=UPI00398C46A0